MHGSEEIEEMLAGTKVQVLTQELVQKVQILTPELLADAEMTTCAAVSTTQHVQQYEY